MKHLENFDQFQINEEWFPRDVFLVPKNKKNTSYLEFQSGIQGDILTEIAGKNRNIELLVDSILQICQDPDSISNIYQAHMWAHKGKNPKDFNKLISKISIQDRDNRDIVLESLSQFGEIRDGNFYETKTLDLVLNKPISVKLDIKYIDS